MSRYGTRCPSRSRTSGAILRMFGSERIIGSPRKQPRRVGPVQPRGLLHPAEMWSGTTQDLRCAGHHPFNEAVTVQLEWAVVAGRDNAILGELGNQRVAALVEAA